MSAGEGVYLACPQLCNKPWQHGYTGTACSLAFRAQPSVVGSGRYGRPMWKTTAEALQVSRETCPCLVHLTCLLYPCGAITTREARSQASNTRWRFHHMLWLYGSTSTLRHSKNSSLSSLSLQQLSCKTHFMNHLQEPSDRKNSIIRVLCTDTCRLGLLLGLFLGSAPIQPQNAKDN